MAMNCRQQRRATVPLGTSEELQRRAKSAALQSWRLFEGASIVEDESRCWWWQRAAVMILSPTSSSSSSTPPKAMTTRFSASWLRELNKGDEEAPCSSSPADDDDEEQDWFGALLPTWARSAVDDVDERMAAAEDQVLASLATVSPWLRQRGKDVSDSAAATLEASRRFRLFLAWLFVSVFFFALALFVGLPVLVLRPQKFALCFTLGSVAYMASFAALRGLEAQLRMLCRRERALFSAAYLLTMLATLHVRSRKRTFRDFVVSVGGCRAALLRLHRLGLHRPVRDAPLLPGHVHPGRLPRCAALPGHGHAHAPRRPQAPLGRLLPLLRSTRPMTPANVAALLWKTSRRAT
mmetsp:Transcript_12017/g.36150  ORF Transcript_12017/g.36150 Transcript_12017/m.36150 type:complete len:351 (+) Transcript_12017:1089-2141(+)